MRVIDARSGQEVRVGQHVAYPNDPEAGYTLLAVRANIFTGKVLKNHDFDGRNRWTPAPIRWFHPGGKGDFAVAIIPT